VETETGHFDHRAFIARYGEGTVSKFEEGKTVYVQGDPASALFYIVSGSVKVIVNSAQGKVAMIAMLEAGDFFGEGCVDGHLLRSSTIVTANKCEIARFNLAVIFRVLKDDLAFSKIFLKFILSRNEKLRRDLVAHLFNSSEKRLARILLTLANNGLATKSEFIDVPIDQGTLAMMVGTTRQRINQFMNKFRKIGYIEYNGHIKVRNSLINVIIDDPDETLK
jgi:CRP/FNR family transcriptional regulator, cyclic AMP receptor protein